MSAVDFGSIQVGDAMPSFTTEPISRLTLALYAGASGDHNPMHVDIDWARAQGEPDVLAHGMLNMAYLGRLLTRWVPQRAIRSFGVRFSTISRVGDRLTCSGVVESKETEQGRELIRLQLTAKDQHDEVKLVGEAVVSLD